MSRMSSVISAGTISFALGVGGISVGHAGGDQNGPVPAFALPSDSPSAQGQEQPYYFRTDPTGQLTTNTANPNIPTEKDNVTNDQFLTYSAGGALKRIDTTQSACQYYLALGETVTGVIGCGPNGEMESIGGIVTFEKWKQDVKIDDYAAHGETDVARFVNLVDLNLTRNHHMISYGQDQLAAYVCNHSGPAKTAADPTGLFPTGREVDGLIRSIKSNANLIACVAMEFSTRGKTSGMEAFTKFFIFGADGNLLSTIDLDGRGPKGVPHVCTACHGGTFQNEIVFTDPQSGLKTLQFDPSSNGDLGAHFLPFDKDNFAFSDKLSPSERNEAIFRLNLDVYTTEIGRVKPAPDGTIPYGGLASASITDLIRNWYDDNLTRNNPTPGFDPNNTVPPQWDALNYNQIYLNSYAHSCRTCHAAMENVPLEREPSLIAPPNEGPSVVCSLHVMPGAKVTFDRFWLSDPFWTFPQLAVPGQSASAPNQPELLNEITACVSFNNP